MVDRAESSFDYAAVESASSQHHRMVRANSVSDQQEPPNDRTLTNMHFFQTLNTKCVIQLELIHAIDHIVFYPSTSRKEDVQYISLAQVSAQRSCRPSRSSTITHASNCHLLEFEFASIRGIAL